MYPTSMIHAAEVPCSRNASGIISRKMTEIMKPPEKAIMVSRARVLQRDRLVTARAPPMFARAAIMAKAMAGIVIMAEARADVPRLRWRRSGRATGDGPKVGRDGQVVLVH